MNINKESLLQNICVIAKSAGESIIAIYHDMTNYQIRKKIDKSPVTEADIISNNIILSSLKNITPNIPILSEENPIPWDIRKNWQDYWLVDPLDGTKEFIQHNGEFTVNIALIEKGKPILGVVYAPALNLMYFASEKQAWKKTDKHIRPISCCQANPMSVIISRSHNNDVDKMNKFLSNLGEHKIIKIGSSLKFCLVAEGKAQLYPRFNNTNIWDTGAGQAVAIASGAHVNDWNGSPLNYIPRESFLNPNFLVST
ncbi:3'(2'),5'-bisphosphate nucleotidase [Candidatus Pantoea edessiphila]|uniref:3'(2'),5'-bisphosphate nucleotidase CysQ n=1 Tax=Candidatus Pantoea edessiphila TaxID=2044610 RepID=A0A2P5SZQ3_9GAMM|nr:3'(2'),5'-bisphosphate nucleotidase CysQ [Candidatus Pantoea edessiphila]PPI87819.1 3'(2'),5'-bisphosphate nucleotidase [Candidatus Pantoea edessiphila]